MRSATALRTVATLAVLVVLSAPHATVPQTCSNDAARNFLGGALADAYLNPSSQEDNQFFTSQAGFPNIFFVIDTSGSMARLPPNGPGFLTGSGEPDPSALPTGTLAATRQQGSPTPGPMGCGPELEFGSLAPSVALATVASRTYHSPCNGTSYENLPYLGHPDQPGGVDYAWEARICPYYTSSEPFQTGVAGYDQDFYVDNDSRQAGSNPNFFYKSWVFHDSAYDGNSYSQATYTRGNGWNFQNVYPWEISPGNEGSIEQFCASFGDDEQPAGGPTRTQICTSCMKKRGWFYDGVHDVISQDHMNVRTPSIWYTGNYLNFFPPKFVIARRVVKDVIANQSRIRMALAQFGPNGASDGSGSWGYQFVRDFNPSCSSVYGNGNWESNRTTYVNDVNALSWGRGTPLASSLFDVARYYHTEGLPWFGTAWEKSSPGYESSSSANQLAVCWSCQSSSVIILTDGVPSPGDGNQFPVRTASLADSNSGKYAGNTTTGIRGVSTADCPKCGEFTGTEDYKNNLTRAAWYFHNYDLRSESAGACGGSGGTLDGRGMPGKQVLDLYTVGFATSQLGDATRILSNAADAGGGIFISADSADLLRQGIFKVFQTINERSTSFSVATVSTLQTTTGHSVVVPRFDPSREAHWAGHLYRFELYSEFVNACTPNGVGDLDCDGACQSVFLQDASGKFIAEDGNGHFIQTGDHPHCDQTPRCVTLGRTCGAFSDPPIPANPWWDAYNALQQQSWKTRSVWTVTDTATPTGVLDQDDAMVRLEATDTVANTLLPYLALGTNAGICPAVARKISAAGDAVTAAVVATNKLECAKTIIRFVLGADVFNESRRSAPDWPPPRPSASLPASATNLPDQDQLLDRPFKLGDIYHSSPVVVDPPLPADGIMCINGLHNQCIDSLWRTPTAPAVAGTNPYDLYAKSLPYQNRRKIVIVGANDGMLHAFNGGEWHANEDDPATPGLDESLRPFNGYFDRGEFDPVGGGTVSGAPVELWAFIPPDLLGKLPQLLVGEHQIFVDGTAMVRDVWVDGAANRIASSSAVEDDLKSPAEFHTVAVVGERRGGTHYFALDLTDATRLASENGGAWPRPRFLWVYPQPKDAESLTFGETFTDFLPIPPPIGPVRIKADANSGRVGDSNTPTMRVAGVADPVPYHERWIALLSGGYDPQYLRGRGVHMVDVWTGREYFDFSYAPSSTGPRAALEYPVAAVQGMTMWGAAERRPSMGFENDGFFDTATFGDTGGQLWVLRFHVPGELTSLTGPVNNWFGGRIFQMGSGGGSLCNKAGGQPFFWITANAVLANSHLYRVFAGTGDRFNLLDTNGGVCGPDNLRACAQKGCSVSLSTAGNTFAMTGVGSEGRGLGQAACGATAQSDFTASFDPSGAWTTCGVKADARVAVSCPGSLSFTKNVAVTCTVDAAGDYGCEVGNSAARFAGSPSYGSTLALSTAVSSWTTYPQSRNWYFGLRVFDDTGARRIFTDATTAAAYDAARYTLVDNLTSPNPVTATFTTTGGWVAMDGLSVGPAPATDAYSPGWGLYFNHGPTVTTEGHTYSVNVLDERTSSASGLYRMLTWNTLQAPLGEAQAATSGCEVSKCTASYRRLSYHYGADPDTGAAFLVDGGGTRRRSLVQNTLVPAQGDQPTVFVNQKGEYTIGLAAVNTEKGASNVPTGPGMDPVMGLGAIEVSRELHDCRHAGIPPPPTDPTARAAFYADLARKCRQ